MKNDDLKFEYVTDPQRAEQWIQYFYTKAEPVGIDIETFGNPAYDPHRASIRLCGLSDGRCTAVLDIAYVGCPELLKVLLQSTDVVCLAHNAIFETKFFKHQWNLKRLRLECTMLIEAILFNGLENTFNLKDVVKRRFGFEMDKELQASDFSGQLTWEQIRYNAFDAYILPHLYKLQMEGSEYYAGQKQRVPGIYERILKQVVDLEMRVLPLIADMELRGISFDLNRVEALRVANQTKVDDLLRKIQGMLQPIRLTGSKWITKTGNLTKKAKELYPSGYKLPETNSEFRQALTQMGIAIPTIKDKATKVEKESLSVATYRKIQHPVGPLLEEYFDEKHSVESFLNPVKDWVNPMTGRVHGSFKQLGARSGRMSMREPNLMQYPREPEYRACAVANQ